MTITDRDREAGDTLIRTWLRDRDPKGLTQRVIEAIAQAREEGRREERERISRMFVERTPGGWPDDDADVPEGWASWILLLHDNEAGDVLDAEEAAAHFLRNMQPAIRARGED